MTKINTHELYKLNHRTNDCGIIERRCTGCQEWLEENADNFYMMNKSKPEKGFNAWCKNCKRLSNIYYNMKARCYNPKSDYYKWYGKKGVIICQEWLTDKNKFYKWAKENGYKDTLTIDRRDVTGNYEPRNCRWITIQEQQNNRTNNVFMEHNGEIKTAWEWSKEFGVSSQALKNRSEKGKDILDDYFYIKININGEIKTIRELSEESGLTYDTIRERYSNGWDISDLIKDVKINEPKLIKINGETRTVQEWAEISGLTRDIILSRMKYGWKNENLIKPRQHKRNKKYIEIDNEVHTVDEWCSIIGINRTTFCRRMKKGLKGEELKSPSQQ